MTPMPDPGSRTVPGEALRTLDLLRSLPGVALAGVYLHGSAAMAGLRGESDVDVLAVLGQPLSPPARKALGKGLLVLSGRPGIGPARPIELIAVCHREVMPWRYPPWRDYLFGEWLREGFERGDVQGPAADPDLALILAQARLHSVPLLGPALAKLLDPVPLGDVRRAMRDCLAGLLGSLRGDERNVLLTLARMWHTAAEGGFLSKDAAARWAAPRLPEGDAALLLLAGQAYRGECADCWEGLSGPAGNLARRMGGEIESLLSGPAPG